MQIITPRSAAAGNGLLSGLVAYWPGNEANGDLVDSHTNMCTLGAVNDPLANTGIVYPTARALVNASAQHFTASHAAIKALNAFTLSAWVYLDSISGIPGAYRSIAGDSSSAYADGFIAFADHVGQLIYLISSGGGVQKGWNTSLFITRGEWQMLTIWHDPSSDVIGADRNGLSVTTTWANDLSSHPNAFWVGKYINANNHYWDGRIGPMAIWDRVLTAADRTTLYNAGAGLKYAEFTT